MSDNKYISMDTDGKQYLKDLSDIDVSIFINDGTYGVGDMSKNIYDTSNDGKCDVSNFSDSTTWSGIIGKPTSSPTLLDATVSLRHSHDNKTILDLLSDSDGQLLYDGVLINTAETTIYTSDLINDSSFITQTQLDKKADRLTTFVEDNIMTINSTGGLRDSGVAISNVVVDASYVHTDNNYTTDEKDNIANQSGVNTGDETTDTIKTKLGVSSTISDGYLTSTDYNKFNNKMDNLQVSKDGTLIGNERQINLIEGSGVSLTVEDNSSTNAVDITISSDNGGGTVKSVNTVEPDVDTGDVTLTKSDIGLENVDNLKQIPMSYLDTATTLGTSDVKVSSQKAVKTYADTKSTVTTSTTNGNIKIDGVEKTVYILPIATSDILGGVKAGDNITIDANGVISSVIAGGDMLQSTYDTNLDGVVNDSDMLGGQLPSYYATASGLALKTSINDSATSSTTQTYSIDKILELIATKQNKIDVQGTQPTSPELNDIWINNATSPYIMSIYNGSIYVTVGGSGGGTISNWTNGNPYSIDDLVIYNDNIYQCIVGNSSETWIDSNWNVVSSGDIQLATTTTDGLLSYTDKIKLDSIMTNGTWDLFQI